MVCVGIGVVEGVNPGEEGVCVGIGVVEGVNPGEEVVCVGIGEEVGTGDVDTISKERESVGEAGTLKCGNAMSVEEALLSTT